MEIQGGQLDEDRQPLNSGANHSRKHAVGGGGHGLAFPANLQPGGSGPAVPNAPRQREDAESLG